MASSPVFADGPRGLAAGSYAPAGRSGPAQGDLDCGRIGLGADVDLPFAVAHVEKRAEEPLEGTEVGTMLEDAGRDLRQAESGRTSLVRENPHGAEVAVDDRPSERNRVEERRRGESQQALCGRPGRAQERRIELSGQDTAEVDVRARSEGLDDRGRDVAVVLDGNPVGGTAGIDDPQALLGHPSTGGLGRAGLERVELLKRILDSARPDGRCSHIPHRSMLRLAGGHGNKRYRRFADWTLPLNVCFASLCGSRGRWGTSRGLCGTWPVMARVSYRAQSAGAVIATALGACLGCGSTNPAPPSDTGTGGDTSSEGTMGAEAPGAETSTGGQGSTAATSTDDMEGSASSGGSEESSGTEDTASPGNCIGDEAAGDHRFECGHLTFEVSVPPRCLRESCGLIVDVHGRTMSAQMQEANTGLRALGLERGYVVIQPNATPAPPLSSWDGPVDDATVVDFVEQSIEAFGVDLDRVHLTGFSQGGSMTWRLLADYGELWASAAPAAACGIGLPSEVVPLLYMHGTLDALTPYACAEPYVEALRAHYRLAGEAVVVDSGEDHVRLRYGDEGPALIELLSHDYDNGNAILGGHCYPGSDDPGRARGQLFTFACGTDEAFGWGETVIDFFDAHPRAAR